MNLFQWITLPLLGVLFLFDLRAMLVRRPKFRRDRVLRCLIWLAAGLAIYQPDMTSAIANSIGIQRGADLVMYMFVLTFLGTTFYFYSQNVTMERRLTEVIRHVALREAKLGAALRDGCSGQEQQ
jgi:hypothetical protein